MQASDSILPNAELPLDDTDVLIRESDFISKFGLVCTRIASVCILVLATPSKHVIATARVAAPPSKALFTLPIPSCDEEKRFLPPHQ